MALKILKPPSLYYSLMAKASFYQNGNENKSVSRIDQNDKAGF